MNIKETINVFEQKLTSINQSLEIIICGGAAIHLLGYSNRPTKDIDVLLPKLPDFLSPLIQEIAQEHRLPKDWLNNGPENLIYDLETGWKERITTIYQGKYLTIKVLSRQDLIFSKLYAMCDRRQDVQDLLAMKVTEEELQTAGEQVRQMDGNPDWPAWVDICISEVLEQRGKHD